MRSDDDDNSSEPVPPSTADRWAAVVFLLLIVGLLVGEVLSDFSPVKLTALFMVGFWIPLLAIHEAGHAVVARLLGWRVRQVVIGMGRPIARFHLGGVPVEIRLFPVQGFVVPAPTNLRAPRLKSALIYFAGPGTEIVLLAVVVLSTGVDRLLSRTEDLGLLAAQALGIAVLVSAFFNLVPHYAQDAEGVNRAMMPNDGMGILLSFLHPLDYYAQQLDHTA